MTREEILALQPGRELDAHIALIVFEKEVTVVGKHYFIDPMDKTCPAYSTDISAAWEVVEEIQNGKVMNFYMRRLYCVAEMKYHAVFENDFKRCQAYEYSLPEAICKAALLATLNNTL